MTKNYENDLKSNEDLDQCERGNGSNECDVDIK